VTDKKTHLILHVATSTTASLKQFISLQITNVRGEICVLLIVCLQSVAHTSQEQIRQGKKNFVWWLLVF